MQHVIRPQPKFWIIDAPHSLPTGQAVYMDGRWVILCYSHMAVAGGRDAAVRLWLIIKLFVFDMLAWNDNMIQHTEHNHENVY